MEQTKTRKVILSMQMTLDGFVEGPDGKLDWITGGDEVWNEMFNDLRSVDTFLLGRKMYPGYSDYWRSVLANPSADKNELEFARIAEKTPHIVFSKTLSKTDWENTRIAKDVVKEIAHLKQQPGKDMMLWGGAAMASAFINPGLVDEYRITLAPIVLGGGKSLFSNLKQR